MKHVPHNEVAADVFRSGLDSYERILFHGAGGWFGKTAISLLNPAELSSGRFRFVGRTTREERINGASIKIEGWSDSILEEFAPDAVLDFAFLTKNRMQTVGQKVFNQVNLELSNRLFTIARFHSVKFIFSTSSGAAEEAFTESGTSNTDNYASQKRTNEIALRQISHEQNKKVAIARPWSVSGGFVGNPEDYAFSDFVLSALRSGTIKLHSTHLVHRRYCAVEDLLALTIAGAVHENFSILDSGGKLIELRDLAREIADEIGGSITIFEHPSRTSSDSDNYFSDNQSWLRLCEEHSFEPLDLRQQISNVVAALYQKLRG